MMPKHIYLHRIYNNDNPDDDSKDFNLFGRYQNEGNYYTSDNVQLPNNQYLKPVSPLILKRSSLIKYDDFLVTDENNDHNESKNEIILHEPERTQKSPSCSLFKTGSMSSLKISSLTEQWPSSEHVQRNVSHFRTHQNCDDQRFKMPSAISSDNFGFNSILKINQPTVSESSPLNPPLSFSSDKAALSKCLSKCDSDSRLAAGDIMKLMDFTDLSLMESLQNFVRRIPVVGESQERDRILMYFTDRYMACNPGTFKDNDSCHTLVCAVMLLNTDIHGQVSKKRMTCKEFVDNLLTNFPDNGYVESDLINVYNFIRKTELKNDDISDSTNTLRHKFSKLVAKSAKTSQEMAPINIDPSLLNQQRFISGNIMRKCIKRSFGKKPTLGHRGWKLQFASLIGLQLLLFKTNLNKNDGRSDQNDFNGDRISLTDSNISSELLHHDDSSLSFTANNGPRSIISTKFPSSCSRDDVQVSVDDVESCIKIHHALAAVVEKLRHKNVFSLRLADQAEYFFKVKGDLLQTWINNINYASAILSAPPIVGAGQCGVYKPLLPGYLTDLDKIRQIESHEIQIAQYRDCLKKLQLVNSKTRSVNEPQIRFCKYEITRFETYLRLLRSQPQKECRTDQVLRRPDMSSIFSIIDRDLSRSSNHTPQSPRSTFSHHHQDLDHSISYLHTDQQTLRRRQLPPPNNSRAVTSPSGDLQHRLLPLQMSPTADSLHSFIVPQYHTPSFQRQMTYSPQIGVHSPYSRQYPLVTHQSFSRFIEPSSFTCYRSPAPSLPAQSPMATLRYQHYRPPPPPLVLSQSVSKLPKYSPPSARCTITRL